MNIEGSAADRIRNQTFSCIGNRIQIKILWKKTYKKLKVYIKSDQRELDFLLKPKWRSSKLQFFCLSPSCRCIYISLQRYQVSKQQKSRFLLFFTLDGRIRSRIQIRIQTRTNNYGLRIQEFQKPTAPTEAAPDPEHCGKYADF
jgi:hypothetical protein